MSDFKLAKIYKIIPLNPEHESDVYIGSTCKPSLAQRLSKHKCDYNRWKNGKYNNVSSFKLFEKYDVENCNIFLIEEYPCENKYQLIQKEGHYIKTIPCINQRIAGRTKQQYYEDNREAILESQREYYEDNRKVISVWKSTKFNCICGGYHTRCHKSTHYKTKNHINYMTKHDDIIEKVNDLIISINNEQFNIITI